MGTPRLTVLLSWWAGWRPVYDVRHVNAVVSMLEEYLHIPFKTALLTDQPATDAKVDQVANLPPDPRNARLVKEINCFRRLRYFDPEFTEQFGTEWVMSIDLDTLILDDITAQIEWAMSDFGFAIIRGRLAVERGQRPYNGSLYLVRVGSHRHIWDEFDWQESPAECARSGWRGSDQVWLSLKLPNAPTLGPEHGFYFYQQYLDSSDSEPEARMLHFAGLLKPWSRMAKQTTPELYAEYVRHLQ